ncbi:MAG: hypothetical protein LBI63_05465 [Candidatus Ancillula sp.]|jgi:hypothetical protein|nr:hypothetical protein [Candidatus Ancillula sp.]
MLKRLIGRTFRNVIHSNSTSAYCARHPNGRLLGGENYGRGQNKPVLYLRSG